MSAVLLTTKLRMPRARRAVIPRPRLVDRLNISFESGDGFSRSLTLLSAPAGYGKTTLLQSWIGELTSIAQSLRVCWLSIDAGDNDVVRFWSYVIASVQAADPQLGRAAAAMLQPSGLAPLGRSQTQTVLTVLINDIADHDEPLLLVLDDYHLIQTPDIHQGLDFLLLHLPPTMHVVIATRADPPLSLSLLRGRNEMVELRAADLAFSGDETARFVEDTMGVPLSDDAIDALRARTEGWAAGLQMAAAAIRGRTLGSLREDATSVLDGLISTQRHILDYLTDEVFAQQPVDTQTFLLRTSILDRLCAPLCDVLMEDDGSADGSPRSSGIVLDLLDRENLFVAPIDDTSTWYRYHPLFADLLRKRLSESHPGLSLQLHQRASTWYEHQSMLSDAIAHALACGDIARAGGLIEEQAEVLLSRGETHVVMGWIESLPDDQICQRPRLCIFHAWALLVDGRSPDLVEKRLRDAVAASATNETRGAAAALQSLLAIYRGSLAEAAELAHQALDLLPESSSFLRSIAANGLGLAYLSGGDLQSAASAFEQVVRISRGTGNLMMTVAALSNLAGIQIMQGHLRLARGAYLEALTLSTDEQGRQLPVAARALLSLGELAREQNDLKSAVAYVDEALVLFDRYGDIGTLIGYLTMARVKLALRAGDAVRDLLAKAGALAAASRVTQLDDRLVSAAYVREWLSEGRLDQATAWAEQHAPEISPVAVQAAASGCERDQDYGLFEVEAISLVRIHLAASEPHRALALVNPMRRRAERLREHRRLVELLALEAIALDQMKRTDEALVTLSQALALAEPEGFIRTFVDEGPPLQSLLLRIRRLDIEVRVKRYVQRLLDAFAAEPAEPDQPRPIAAGARSYLEPLSSRELEVLHLIAQGMTNREIASELFIALDTVKGHTREIYSKLGVHSRTAAAAEARSQGLID